VARDGPAGLADQLRSRGSDGDVHLVGGPRAIRAFQELGALDRLEILVLPVLLGAGVPLSPRPAPPLRLLSPGEIFPDGTARLGYAVA
jgi:dihydrofolate reductase